MACLKALAIAEHLFHCEIDVSRDLPQQHWRNVPAFVNGHGRATAILMSKLFVRAALTNFDESEPLQNGDNFIRL